MHQINTSKPLFLWSKSLNWHKSILCFCYTKLLIRKAVGSGPWHSSWKWLPFTMSFNTHGTWKCENEYAYTYRGTGSPLNRSTLKGADDMAQAVKCCLAGTKSWVQISMQPKTKKIFGAEDITQWESVCPACARPWVQFPSIANQK
jgi:hypothetical protein